MQSTLENKSAHRIPPAPVARRYDRRYVTEDYLCQMFRRSEPTIFLWRQSKGLPHVEIPGDDRPTIRFLLKDVLAWAKAVRVRTYAVNSDNSDVADDSPNG